MVRRVGLGGTVAGADVSFAGATPAKPYTSSELHDPDVCRFFFAGFQADGASCDSYLGETPLR